jgi:hypothetical protein
MNSDHPTQAVMVSLWIVVAIAVIAFVVGIVR